MVQRHGQLPKPSVSAIRWGAFAALVLWAIFTWERPDRVILPTILGGFVLAICLFVERKKNKL
jgi:hypothetical protein